MKFMISALCFIALIAAPLIAADPEITISKETTYVTEPKTDDGFVDLITAINAKNSEGVTQENNAAAVIFPVLVARPDKNFRNPEASLKMADRFYEELGVPMPKDGDDEFITLTNYMILEGIEQNSEKYRHIQDQQGVAQESPWSREEFPVIAGWLDANEKPLDVIIAGVQREKYYSPINSDAEVGTTGQSLIGILLPHIQSFREVTRALNCRALLLAEEGKHEEAWRDLIASYRLGRHVRNGTFIIESLVGIAIEAITNQTMLIFIEQSKPNALLTEKYLNDLAGLTQPKSMAEFVSLSERLIFIDIVGMIAYDNSDDVLGIEDGLPQIHGMIKKTGLKIDWNLILKSGNKWYDQYVEAMKIESFTAQEKELNRINNELQQLSQRFKDQSLLKTFAFALLDEKTRSKYVGDILISLLLPACRQASIAERRSEQRFDNLRIGLALAGYHADENSYPEQLQLLVPKYLESLPQDQFAEKQMTYQKTETGYLLYSIGSNQEDDGGKSFDERKDDLVVKVPAS